MDAVTLLETAQAAGFTVAVEGERLQVRGPKAAVAILNQLRERKADIVRLLRGPDDADDDEEFEPPPRAMPPSPPWCQYRSHWHGWRSIYGPHLICATCHPPAIPGVVAEWLEHGEES